MNAPANSQIVIPKPELKEITAQIDKEFDELKEQIAKYKAQLTKKL